MEQNNAMRTGVVPNFRFISIEGMDCVGKSSLIDALTPHLQSRLDEYSSRMDSSSWPVRSFSPWEGDERWTRQIRHSLIHQEFGDNKVQMMAIFAARRALVVNKLLPHLREANGFAIVDRYVATTFAYQCEEVGDMYLWADLMRQTCESLMPTVTIYLSSDGHTVRERMAQRGDTLDAIESRFAASELYAEGLDVRFRSAFSTLAHAVPGSLYLEIDARQSMAEVHAEAFQIIDAFVDTLFSLDAVTAKAGHDYLTSKAANLLDLTGNQAAA